MPQDLRRVVLVVEDEPLIMLDAAGILEEAGFRVIEAGTADRAIEILESGIHIDIVFTDIEMPGTMDGLRLSHAIRDRWPPVRLIVTSGRVSVTASELPVEAAFLPKPYSRQRLLAATGAAAP